MDAANTGIDRPTNGMGDSPYRLCDKPFAELSPFELYRILRLRSEVFVVEQDCVFLDADGLDIAPTVRHIWIERDRQTVAVCRLLDEGIHREIGRIATSTTARGAGLASKLIDYCLSVSDGPWHLSAQERLTDWYRGFGFVPVGDRYLEDGIWHIKMIRPDDVTGERTGDVTGERTGDDETNRGGDADR